MHKTTYFNIMHNKDHNIISISIYKSKSHQVFFYPVWVLFGLEWHCVRSVKSVTFVIEEFLSKA